MRYSVIRQSIVVLVAVALLGIRLQTSAQAAEVRIRLATESPKGTDVQILLDKFRERVEQRSPGQFKIDVFFGGALGTFRQLQEQVQLGTIEGIGTGSELPEVEPVFGVFDVPFLFKDREHAFRVLDGEIGKSLRDTLIRKRGIRILAFGEVGFRQVTNNVRPIMKPADLQGLKIRVPPNKLRIAAFKALGAAATPIPYKELYTALQSGVVDGQENPLAAISALSMWEVQKYMSITNHVFTPGYLIVNERWWQSLTPDQRRLLQEAADEAAVRQRAEVLRNDHEALEKLRARGMQIDTPDLKPFSDATRTVWKELGEAGGELIEQVLKLR